MKKIITTTLLSLISTVAIAENVSGTTKATASISSSCVIQANNVSFGDYNPNKQSNATQSINILCTKGTAYAISSKVPQQATTYPWPLNMPNNPYRASGVMKNTQNGKDELYYEMYFEWAGYWDQDMDLSSQQYKAVGNGQTQTLNIPYRLVAGQFAMPGDYSASHTFNINF